MIKADLAIGGTANVWTVYNSVKTFFFNIVLACGQLFSPIVTTANKRPFVLC